MSAWIIVSILAMENASTNPARIIVTVQWAPKGMHPLKNVRNSHLLLALEHDSLLVCIFKFYYFLCSKL